MDQDRWGPRGWTSIDHKVMAYASNILSLYEIVLIAVKIYDTISKHRLLDLKTTDIYFSFFPLPREWKMTRPEDSFIVLLYMNTQEKLIHTMQCLLQCLRGRYMTQGIEDHQKENCRVVNVIPSGTRHMYSLRLDGEG